MQFIIRAWNMIVPALAVMLSLAPMNEAHSQKYPNKPIRIVIPFTAGSQTDLLARMIGPKMSENWGQQVIVDNRPSAGGIVAGNIVAKATPDGYTLMLSSNAFAVSAALYSKLPYDPLKDFTGVALVASNPLVLVVSPKLGAKSVRELIEIAKAKPGQINFGSAGIGSGTHMGGEQFKLAAGVNVVHVPYRGTPEALIDTMTGRIQYWFSPMGPALPFIADGKLLALAVTTTQRSPVLRDVPTVAEAALLGFDYDMWFGVLAPARTPRSIVAQLSEVLASIVGTSEIRERMQLQGVETKAVTPEAFAQLISTDIKKLGKVVNAAGIKID
jgi:tripartite-type tricarboxylate transporter receptor subunit TctC